jgi:hypothetical protein
MKNEKRMTTTELLGMRVTRKVFMDDGTWSRYGDGCLNRSPLKHGTVIKNKGREIVVRWDSGEEQRLLPHGVNCETSNE